MSDEQLKPGDKVSPGHVVGKDGQVEESASKKLLRAGKNVAEAYVQAKTGGMLGGKGKGVAPSGKPNSTGVSSSSMDSLDKANLGPGNTDTDSWNGMEKLDGGFAPKGYGSGNLSVLKGKANKSPIISANLPKNQQMNPKQAIGNAVDKVGDQIAEKMDENPVTKKAAEELKDAADTVNNAADAYKKAKSGDIKGAVESAKKAKKSAGKVAIKAAGRAILGLILGLVTPFFFFIIIIVVTILPFIAGFAELADFIGDMWDDITETFGFDSGDDSGGGGGGGSTVPIVTTESVYQADISIIESIPYFDSLSYRRQGALKSAVLAIGVPYAYGGAPTSYDYTGLSAGVDGMGYFQWMIWSSTYADLGHLKTSELNSSGLFRELNPMDVAPGDIGVLGEEVGIYLGNNQWIHADISEGGTNTYILSTFDEQYYELFYALEAFDVSEAFQEPTTE